MRGIVLAFFLLSGVSGLLYEMVWIRSAGTVIGNTTYAVGTVVGVYMGGLALGAWFGGRLADRRSGGALLRLYGAVECGVAASALAVPRLLQGSGPLFRVLWQMLGEVAPVYATLRVLLVAVILLVPTSLMGATLPILARFLSTSASDAARATGGAYALNSLGGVLGTLLAGFWLVPDLGLRATTLLAAALNLAIGAASVLLGRGREGGLPPEEEAGPPPPRLPLVISALSGFTALAYEVAWTRSLVLTLGATVTAFTLILAAFILGLALGSALSAWGVPRLTRLPRALGLLELAVGAIAIVLLPFLGDLPLRFAPHVGGLRADPPALLRAEFGLAALFVLVPAGLLGAVFPVAIRMALPSDRSLGRSVAAVYSWNTAGSIAGTLVATFLSVPVLGLSATIRLAATVNFAAAAWLLRPRALLALPLLATLGAWLLPAWNPQVLASGAFLVGPSNVSAARRKSLDLGAYLAQDTELVASYWDAYGLVTVHRHREDGTLSLRVNGKQDASSGTADRIDMMFVGHLPLLHHPRPRRALLIGLGAGVTLSAMQKHPLDQLDCVELSTAVVQGARHFREVTGDLFRDPRTRLTTGDGRNAIAFGREPYDVIVSQPSHLWISGMATLFTRDFFEEASHRLSPDGIFGQWVHARWLSAGNFREVVRTFFEVFPHGSLWEVFPGSDYVLLGSRDPIRRTVAELGERIARLHALEEYVGPDRGAGLVGHLVADAEIARRACRDAPLITDDRCTIEYTAPRWLGHETRPEFLDWLDPLRDGAVERELYPDADGLVARKRQARRYLARAVRLYCEGGHQKAFHTLESVRNDLFLDPRTLYFIDQMSSDVLLFAADRIERGDVRAAATMLGLIPPESRHRAEAQQVLEALLPPRPR
jgi:spermidine synthase